MNFDLSEYKDAEGVSLLERVTKFASAANSQGFAFIAVMFDGPLGENIKWIGNVSPDNAWQILLRLSKIAHDNKASLDFRITGEPTRMD